MDEGKLNFNESGTEYRIEVFNNFTNQWDSTLTRFKSDLEYAVENATKIMHLDIFSPVWRLVDENDHVIYEADRREELGL